MKLFSHILLFVLGFIIGLWSGDIIRAFQSTPKLKSAVKKELCAETQGKYDFCVQKVNWEVKK